MDSGKVWTIFSDIELARHDGNYVRISGVGPLEDTEVIEKSAYDSLKEENARLLNIFKTMQRKLILDKDLEENYDDEPSDPITGYFPPRPVLTKEEKMLLNTSWTDFVNEALAGGQDDL